MPLAAITTALGMTTTTWMRLPPEAVPVASLTPIQAPAPLHDQPTTGSGDPCIHVVELAGVRWIEDGTHRHARAVRDGHDVILARVLRITIRSAAA